MWIERPAAIAFTLPPVRSPRELLTLQYALFVADHGSGQKLPVFILGIVPFSRDEANQLATDRVTPNKPVYWSALVAKPHVQENLSI